jgi:hypothetical protein
MGNKMDRAINDALKVMFVFSAVVLLFNLFLR